MSHKAGIRLTWLAIGLPLSLVTASPALAQMGGGMGPGMSPMGQPPSPHEDKEEGPAEEAPDAEAKAPDDLDGDTGYANQDQRRTKMIEIDGSFRLRGDWFYKLHMSQGYASSDLQNKPPFPLPTECIPAPGSNQDMGGGCGSKSLGMANTRLRIEPTFNVSDQVRVRTQFDVFDKMILGTSLDSLAAADPAAGRSDAAAAPFLYDTTGSAGSTLQAKRAWGEVDTELGSIRFGRMPWHFGRGMYFNRGDGRDAESGTTVDRVMLLTTVYGHQFAAAYDFGSQGYTIGATDLGQRNLEGFPLDLSQKDDVNQYMLSLSKIDTDRAWRERINAGDLVLNYGVQVVYRSQSRWTYQLQTVTTSTNPDGATTPEDVANLKNTVNANAQLFIPSVWVKLGWKALTLEFESTVLAGKMDDAGPLRLTPVGSTDNNLKIRQAGFVLATSLNLYENSLFLGFETGGATGDQAEVSCDQSTGSTNNCSQGYLNYRWRFVPQPLGDNSLNNFHFSPEYHVDEIFFRRIMGTVTNALYVKPSVSYWLATDSSKNREVGINAAAIYSMAAVPVATPGNASIYGLEMDLGVSYRNNREGFYAGATWAVFWPLSALDRPAAIWGTAETARAPQAFRTFLGIKF